MTKTLNLPYQLIGSEALVTGGNTGLGAGVTAGLLQAGANVTVLSRSAPGAELYQAADSVRSTLRHIAVDLSDAEQTRRELDKLLLEREVHILVNNAGVQRRYPAEEFPMAEFDAVLDVNLRAVFQVSQLVAQQMLKRGSGRIISIASLLSYQGGINVAAYAASKGAVAQLTKALSNEWSGRGVNVNAIAPGYMDTALNEQLISDPVRSRQISERIPIGRWGQSEDVAGAACFLASTAADYVTGIVLPVDGGWLAR
ncbi:SDR family oxidoreductase [Leucobacter sp. UCD-THU]|uniref:SDR family oxidoreductase n=1 Tax=Leucobacter sp. UCD-THU TaxID=1292023 RepID=UPI0009DA0C58|nr:SDR family oxidoreductase [Leucobacter sp. UCD-THU]